MKLLWLKTTRVSTVILAFLERYPESKVKLGKRVMGPDQLSWCTNRRLMAACDFSLVHDDIEVLGFHDGPRNMWAHELAQPLVEKLAEQRVLRFSIDDVQPCRPGFIARIIGRVFGDHFFR